MLRQTARWLGRLSPFPGTIRLPDGRTGELYAALPGGAMLPHHPAAGPPPAMPPGAPPGSIPYRAGAGFPGLGVPIQTGPGGVVYRDAYGLPVTPAPPSPTPGYPLGSLGGPMATSSRPTQPP